MFRHDPIFLSHLFTILLNYINNFFRFESPIVDHCVYNLYQQQQCNMDGYEYTISQL